MKRYRFLGFFIDTARNVFRADVPSAIMERVKIEESAGLKFQYGEQDFNAKFERWFSIPKPSVSVVDEHTHLLEDIERAYVAGGLYAALTGACCLGERIFNQIILRIRESYKSHPQYKYVFRSGSINDWNLGLDTLREWNILTEPTENMYRRLYKLRTEAVHFQDKDQILEPMAKEGIELINGIVTDLFGLGPENKFVSWCEVPGEIYLHKEYENTPFVREFYLSSAVLVGYKHTVESTSDLGFVARDDNSYPDTEISDAEFVRLRKEHNNDRSSGV
jgi:hypothetical protein